MISVDSKKKELIGDYRNAGHEGQPAGQPVRVKTHDFPGQAAKAIPYGIYDMTANTGWVSIGTDHDTAAFAVASIRRWWQAVGRHDYPGARRLLITADGGGSNGYRTRGWKTQLADLAAETGLEARRRTAWEKANAVARVRTTLRTLRRNGRTMLGTEKAEVSRRSPARGCGAPSALRASGGGPAECGPFDPWPGVRRVRSVP